LARVNSRYRWVQFRARPGIVDSGWGHPFLGPAPSHQVQTAAARVVGPYGVDSLNYGHAGASAPPIGWLPEWAGRIHRRRASLDETSVRARTSQAIDHVREVKP